MQVQNESVAQQAAETVEKPPEQAVDAVNSAATAAVQNTEETEGATQAPQNVTEAAREAAAKLLKQSGVEPGIEKQPPVGGAEDGAGEKPVTEAAPSEAPPVGAEIDGATTNTASELSGITLQEPKKEESVNYLRTGSFNFMMGLALLALFVWYIATDNVKRRRLAGTILSVLVTILCILFYQELGIQKGIELQGGVSMDIRIQPVEGRTITPETQQELIKILHKRFNQFSTSELILAPQGDDGISLQMPGATPEELEKIEKELAKVSKLEFFLVHPDSRRLAPIVASGGHVEIGYQALPYRLTEAERKLNAEMGLEDEPVRWELVKFKADMAGKFVDTARAYYGDRGWGLSVEFKGEGGSIMGALTRENVNRQLAIVLDGEVISAPNIEEPFSSSCSITGDFSQQEAQTLAAGLENPLENPINIANSSYISPTLGSLTVKQGVTAGIAGLAATLIFIVFYYRLAGVIALLCLCLNIALIFGALALFRSTLTLPGIAGIILTIGVAIDANVLIFERLREELRGGKSLKAAIDMAYDKAFSAIIDANITTLITAFVLYFLAEGTVKGFAITLIIGICACLFASLIVTRILFSWGTDSFIKKLSFMDFSPSKAIDFFGKQKVCLTGSVLAVVVSLGLLGFIQPLGVELKGGDKVTIEESNPAVSVPAIKDSLAKAGLKAQPIVQMQEPVGGEGKYFVIQVLDGEAGAVKSQLAKDFNVSPERVGVESVGSQVGEHMLRQSAIALFVGLIAIMIYVTFRYELAFALGAIVALVHDLIITAGILTLLGQELSLISIGALLTIAGYSINDTIIIFDRVREGLATRKGKVADVMNHCINATLSRTIITSSTTLFVVLVLYLFGGPGMRSFGLVLTIGILVGTYSSIFVAAPIVLWWARRSGTNLRRAVLDSDQSKIDPLATA